jgi:hypothetical protein
VEDRGQLCLTAGQMADATGGSTLNLAQDLQDGWSILGRGIFKGPGWRVVLRHAVGHLGTGLRLTLPHASILALSPAGINQTHDMHYR